MLKGNDTYVAIPNPHTGPEGLIVSITMFGLRALHEINLTED